MDGKVYKIIIGKGAFGKVRLGISLLSTPILENGKFVVIKKTISQKQ